MLAEGGVARRVVANQPTADDSAFLARARDAVDPSILSFEYVDSAGALRWNQPPVEPSFATPDRISPASGAIVPIEFPIVDEDGRRRGTFRARVRLSGVIPMDSARLAVPGSLLAVEDRRSGELLVALDDSAQFPRTGSSLIRSAEWISVERDLRDFPVRLALAAPSAPYVRPFERAALFGMLSLLAVTLVVVIATTLMTTRLAHSVNDLADAADGVAGGELTRDVSAAGPVEMHRLAAAFNRMTVSLREVLAELSQRRALAAVGEFAGSLSHEVRNALTPVQVDLERAEERSTDDPRTNALISRALSQVRRLDEAVTGALAVARSGFVARERVDLNSTLKAAVQHAESSFRETESTAVLCAGESPIWVNGDSNALRQLFTNILVNSGQAFTSAGNATIRTRVDADRVTVVIADDGPGIPSTILPKVDQPFFTTRQNGTGLGLPISRQIAKAHGGFLEIESEAGQGTTVSVTLPLG
jgi:signal transduction histidine kinase